MHPRFLLGWGHVWGSDHVILILNTQWYDPHSIGPTGEEVIRAATVGRKTSFSSVSNSRKIGPFFIQIVCGVGDS